MNRTQLNNLIIRVARKRLVGARVTIPQANLTSTTAVHTTPLSTTSPTNNNNNPLSPYPPGRTRHLIPLTPTESAQGRSLGRSDYELISQRFVWPHLESKLEYYNIGVDICDKWALSDKKDSPALLYEDADNGHELVSCSFSESYELSNRLGYALQQRLGLQRGDRVAILMSQSIETALVHMSVYKSGAIAVPLFILFGPEALEYRLQDCGAKIVFVEQSKLDEVLALKAGGKLPNLEHIVLAPPLSAMRYQTITNELPASSSTTPTSTSTSNPSSTTAQVHHLSTLLANSSSNAFRPTRTRLDDPALIIYTSGTTGPPKGALHAHRVLLGHMPGVEFPHEFFPQTDARGSDLFWTPADWAWIGGLIDVLLPSLHHGVPVYACRFKKFDPELAFSIIARRKIRNMFMPPTALKLMRSVPNAEQKYPGMIVRSIGSGGESLGDSLLEWGRKTFRGITINEFYGQTECNLVLGNCSSVFPTRAGSMGKPIPGHTVHVVNDAGQQVADGEVGNIGILAPHPVMMLQYWNKPTATKEKYAGNYLITGDLAKRDQDGYFWFFGRSDDVIKSSGYRIGPAEIEDCLLKHEDVSNVAAIGVPDPLRGERVKVYIVLRPGTMQKYANGPTPLPENKIHDFLKESIAQHVKGSLAAYEYPREIEFIDALPMTNTGKVIRKDLKKRHMEEEARTKQTPK